MISNHDLKSTQLLFVFQHHVKSLTVIGNLRLEKRGVSSGRYFTQGPVNIGDGVNQTSQPQFPRMIDKPSGSGRFGKENTNQVLSQL